MQGQTSLNGQDNSGRITNKDWRMRYLYWIIDRNQNKIKFKRNKAQVHFNQHKALRNIILKSRRLGFTTLECIDMLDDCLFTPNFEGLMIAHKKEEADKIFDRKIHYAWKNLHQQLKDRLWTVETNRANELKFNFPNNDVSAISVSTSGRSGSYNRVHITELAKLCKDYPQAAIEVLTGTIPAVPTTGRVDIESTAQGEEGDFYEMFMEAWERGEPRMATEFKAHFYNWQWDEDELKKISDSQIENFITSQDYTTHWAELKGSFYDYKIRNNLTDREITYYYQMWCSLHRKFYRLFQEFPLTVEEAFATSGVKLFDKNAIDNQKKYEKEGEKVGDWIYYEGYKSGHTYAIGGDVGHGVGKDSSTLVAIDFTPLRPKVVAEYASNEIDAAVFAYEAKSGGVHYGNCLVAIENNDRGYATNVELSKIYKNLYIRKIEGKTEEQTTKEYGWRTTGATKPKMMLELKSAYNDDLIEIPSKRINREARTYDENDLNVVRFDEEQTKHWDLLTALAISWQMRTEITTQGSGGFNLSGKKRNLS